MKFGVGKVIMVIAISIGSATILYYVNQLGMLSLTSQANNPFNIKQLEIDSIETMILCDADTVEEYYRTHTCDNNMAFLNGECKNSNNGYNFCDVLRLHQYIELRGLTNAPQPRGLWNFT
jgi:uncharacterized CHY-type Zn-finger protein